MSKVSIELGATIKTTDYGNVKPVIRVDDIDPEGDVEAQVAIAIEAAETGLFLIDKALDLQIKKLKSGN